MELASYILANVLIVGWLIFASTWCLPQGAFLHGLTHRWYRVVNWCGLWHGWGMFMTPPTANLRFRASIEYTDGTHESWGSLLHGRVGFVHALVGGLIGKLEENQLCRDDSPYHRPIAVYLSRYLADPDRTVVCVRLYRDWLHHPEPGAPSNSDQPFNRHQLLEWRPEVLP